MRARGGGLIGQLALARSPGLPGDQRGHQADRGVAAEQQRRPDPAEGHEQQRGDERGEAGHHRRDLVGQRRSRRAGVGREQLGEPGALGAGQRVLAPRSRPDTKVAMINRKMPVLTSRNISTPKGTRERADPQVDGAPADLVGEPGPGHGGDDADRRRRCTARSASRILVASSSFLR